jgi:RNA recognition motif-containing protein
MSVRLFVGNLPYDVTEPDLRELFAPVGQLSTVIIPVDRETGRRRGFAFVEFSDSAQAEEATRRFNNQPFRGRNITINEARARESRTDYGSGVRSSYPMRPAGGGSRPGFSSRPSVGGPDFAPNPMEEGRPGRAERRNRNFGADAKPSRKRKNNYGSRGEMGLKRGPLRERGGGQFFGGFDDDDYDDGRELDYMADFKESGEEEDVV